MKRNKILKNKCNKSITKLAKQYKMLLRKIKYLNHAYEIK